MRIRNCIWFALADNKAIEELVVDGQLSCDKILPVPVNLVGNLTSARLQDNNSQAVKSAEQVISNWKSANWGTTNAKIAATLTQCDLTWYTTAPVSVDFLTRLSSLLGCDIDYFCAGENIGSNVLSYTVDKVRAYPNKIENADKFACNLWNVDFCEFTRLAKIAKAGTILASSLPALPEEFAVDCLLELKGD